MTFTAEDIDSVTVNVRRDTFPTTQPAAQVVERLYDITSAGGAGTFTADVSFEYETAELNGQTPANFDAYRYNEGTSSWETHLGTVDEAARRVTITGVTEFSKWVLAGNVPTAVSLSQFSSNNNSPLPLATFALLLFILTSTIGWLAVKRR